ncbi:MAG: 2-oxoglutarate dehydrogenase complex dihydrolipoyllysine-residue succinyltransferase [Bacteroidales bacterium]|nr:2-oxoglutarate dehydrogenase complex dihydrolipoyllysine-residue succinyltransferase [Bacteroidales bacterium]
MIIEIVIPSPGESITEVELANWLVEDGSFVKKDQEIAEVESDKATLPLIAEKAGKIKFLVQEGDTLKVGTVACNIDTSVSAPETEEKKVPAQPVKEEYLKEKTAQTPEIKKGIKVTPLAKKMMNENNLSVEDIVSGLKKITTKEVNKVLNDKIDDQKSVIQMSGSRESVKEPMSSLRQKLSERLVAVKNKTAMLTTFNEVDMTEVIALRKIYQKDFTEKHGVKLGYMSFFTKAVTEALKIFPKVNTQIEGENIVYPKFVDIGIAVQTDKGLMVPVLRNTESMNLADIEKNIVVLAEKARKFRLSIEEMTGGTFTITNGGIFGSMLSTPILNPPQTAILGMHNIVDRPVAIDGKVEIRPIMYLALSYDHRLVDGRDSVSFLVQVKELLESPVKMIPESDDPIKILLDL